MEGAGANDVARGPILTGQQASTSRRNHRTENFPVASVLIAKRHRGAILAFYRFARAADDIADHPALARLEKLDRLDRLEATLFDEDEVAAAVPLRDILAERRLTARHPCDLLTAFRRDVENPRLQSFADLMDYCAVSAMPVGRFVLDIHGESTATWDASDALCAALQIINHLQDCARDFRELDRVYIPLDDLSANGAVIADLGGDRASAPLMRTIEQLTTQVSALLVRSSRLAPLVADIRLRMEIATIQRLAERLTERLIRGDPLTDDVYLGKPAMLMLMLSAAAGQAAKSLLNPRRSKLERGVRNS